MSFLFLIRSFACALMMDGAPGDIVLPGGIEQPEAVIEAPAVIGVWVAVATQKFNNRRMDNENDKETRLGERCSFCNACVLGLR